MPDRAVAVPPRDRRRPPLGARARGADARRARFAPSFRRRSTASSAARSPRSPGGVIETAGELVAAARSALGLVETAPAPAARASGGRSRSPLRSSLVAAAAPRRSSLTPRLRRRPLGRLPELRRRHRPGVERARRRGAGRHRPGGDRRRRGRRLGRERRGRDGLPHRSGDTRARARTIAVGDYPSDVTVGERHGLGRARRARRADAHQPRAEPGRDSDPGARRRRPVRRAARRASRSGDGAVWFVCEAADLGRIDIRTGTARRVGLEAGLLTSPNSVLPEFSDIAFGLGSLWIVNRAANSVIEVDPVDDPAPARRSPSETRRPRSPSAPDSLWVANFEDDTVTRIAIPGRGQTPTLTHDPRRRRPGRRRGRRGQRLGRDSSLDRSVTRIDPESGDVEATIGVGNEPQRVAAGEGGVWVTVRAPHDRDRDGRWLSSGRSGEERAR